MNLEVKEAPECRPCTHLQAHHSKKTNYEKIIFLMEKVSAVALAAFALYTNFKLFIPFFILGIGLGIHVYLQHNEENKHINPGSPCSQEFMERLTGIKLPAPASLFANVAITICHIDHHDTVFVPIVATTIGAWAGDMMMHCGDLLSRKFADFSKRISLDGPVLG